VPETTTTCTPTQHAYGGHDCSPGGESLPNTGLEVALIIVIAVLLVIIGYIMRKFPRF
jgi:hypothetical protein